MTVVWNIASLNKIRNLGLRSMKDIADRLHELVIEEAKKAEVPGPTKVKGYPTYRAVRRGTNWQSIQTKTHGLKGEIFSTSGYGGWIEIGTRSHPATPYFIPGMRRMKGALGDALKPL